jgi:hypothetical protein
MRIPYISILAAGALALGGCAYGGFGYGVGYGGGGSSGDSGYRAPYLGYGYAASDPFGWYGDYYYPGTGIFVFDRDRHRHRWDGDQQRYWSSRRTQWESRSGHHWSGDNWSGFDHHRDGDRDGRRH